MIGRIIVAENFLNTSGSTVLCVFFHVGASRLLLFSNLFGEVVGGMACFFRISCQTLCVVVLLKVCNVLCHLPSEEGHENSTLDGSTRLQGKRNCVGIIIGHISWGVV